MAARWATETDLGKRGEQVPRSVVQPIATPHRASLGCGREGRGPPGSKATPERGHLFFQKETLLWQENFHIIFLLGPITPYFIL